MILLYHSIVPTASPAERWTAGQALRQVDFERQIAWLGQRRRIVSLAEYLDLWQRKRIQQEKALAITFDDGFYITYDCAVPVLRHYQAPATFFVATGHLDGGELLWFSYLKGLCFEKTYRSVKVEGTVFELDGPKQVRSAWEGLRRLAKDSGDPLEFSRELSHNYPLPQAVREFYGGMTKAQLVKATEDPLVEIGAHTVYHPYLDQLAEDDQRREIEESRRSLLEICGKDICYLAYPGGEYNRASVEIARQAGFEAAFVVIPKRIGNDARFEMSRMGIYSAGLIKLQVKLLGVGELARRIGWRVG